MLSIHSVYELFFRYFRIRRVKLFYNLCRIQSSTTCLDVGGNLYFWEIARSINLPLPRLTIVNLYPPSRREKECLQDLNACWLVADGRVLPFPDNSFDIVFCNSVIEHLSSIPNQQRFANEICRVGKQFFVQTPNKGFFVEPHLVTPFIHWFPRSIQQRLIRNYTIWGIITRPTSQQVNHFLNEVNLLGKADLARLFPSANIISEKWIAFDKSLIAVKM